MRIAVIENSKIVNVVISDPETASELYDEFLVETEDTGDAWIGAKVKNGKIEPPFCPKGWTWDEDLFEYLPPTPKPADDFVWDSEGEDWIQLPPSGIFAPE